ncbi:MAG TPA: pH regulation protein F [Acidilobales archaeon]|nr:MAG: pH regulation protein F [Desulfurococcales archaeon ex4484_42]HDD26882.1 pH regulation protein F [Acidilobales archaeon]
MIPQSLVDIYLMIISSVFLLAFTLYTIRVFKGPTIPDMVIAIDCLSFDLAVFLGLLSVLYRTPFLITGALLLALWAFLFDLFIAKYILKKLR